jgi:hypothetical protein
VNKEQPDYVSFMLRLWRENADAVGEHGATGQVWRASLESSRTGERWGFANLRELFAFLRRHTSGVEEGDGEHSRQYD